ncbi:MAG TPA: GspH/FimT family pseudopilin [Pseudomonadales bacterium]
MRRHAGFTLVELMITVTVLMTVVALAAPSFTDTIRDHQVRSTANDFYSLIRFARAEALRSGDIVRVLPLANEDWSKGARALSADNTELRRVGVSGDLKILEKNNIYALVFNGKGYLPSQVVLTVGRNQPGKPARDITVLLSGFAWNNESSGS